MGSSAIQSHRIRLLTGGQAYFDALVQAIDASYREVLLETYILHVEGAVVAVVDALLRAARRGVVVRLVVDGAGTPTLPDHWVQAMALAGVQWHRFLPLQGLQVMVPRRWRRLHRKLCVIDGRLLFCGGINLLDDHIDLNHGPQEVARLDFAVCVSGEMVGQAQRLMAGFWARLLAQHQFEERQYRAAGASLVSSSAKQWPTHIDVSDWSDGTAVEVAKAGLILRDNVRNRLRIERAYRRAITQARSEILIANAYFLPGRALRQALVQAARRGVRVRLVLQGRYEYFLQYHATRAVYGKLLLAGIEIWEYQAGFLHAKVAVVDGHWSTVGSSNLDPLSLLLAREANVVVDDAQFAATLRSQLLARVHGHTRQLDPAVFARRPLKQRFFDALAYAVARLSVFLLGKRY
ncbi:cardiolipin synthase ClsB [Curvibacter sp. APW13]|uniref:cardiolipin synthase ClsB n=1 Tax=Curvibacter sp. APW13 TaxID=3077236 RepID=UPI0028DDB0EC|nr:cardiolipin synthase ClsB [Curvibacter sp. APW13]MDT8989498.1 cardiolipin synthase ClsB [Curvibacter sp. APW13]